VTSRNVRLAKSGFRALNFRRANFRFFNELLDEIYSKTVILKKKNLFLSGAKLATL